MRVIIFQSGVNVLGMPIYIEHTIQDFKSPAKYHKKEKTKRVLTQKQIIQH